MAKRVATCEGTSTDSNIADLPDIPFHPPVTYTFPKREFGKKHVKCSCQRSWFTKWKWLHYNEDKDAVFCHVCVSALKHKKMQTSRSDPSFISRGFTYWKDGTVRLASHEASSFHREAIQVVVELPKKCADIGEMLSNQHSDIKKTNRECLLKILASMQYLARQGISFRGDGDEVDSNLMQLLTLRAKEDAELQAWMERKNDRYLSHDMQNELLKVMALTILAKIGQAIKNSKFFSIMCDECTDASNREQLAICIRWVDDQLQPHEDFIGLYQLDKTTADFITGRIKDVLVRLELPLSRCRGQCFDGASTMRGARNGVAKQLNDEESRAVYIHCYGHALSLAAGDSIKNSKIMKDALDITFEVSKLIKFSPKRDVMFEKLKDTIAPDTPGFRVLCPTRWTVRVNSLKSVLDNYIVLQELWEQAKDEVSDPSIKSRIIGVQTQFKTFQYFYGVILGELILKHSDNLSKTLQSPKLSASEGQHVAEMTVRILQTLRNDTHFDLFWEKVEVVRKEFDVGEPQLPRKRRLPRRFDDGNAEPEFFSDCKQYYRQQYYEALDLIISCIKDRFDQIGYRIYCNLQDLLLKAVKKEPFEEEFSFYGTDIDPSQLRVHLQVLAANFPEEILPSLNIFDIKDYVLSLSQTEQCLMSEVITVLALIIVVPSTNAVSECSFSAMRRVKTYLRSTMGQQRLNHLLLLHVHKSYTDELDLVAVANRFVESSSHQLTIFGKFQ